MSRIRVCQVNGRRELIVHLSQAARRHRSVLLLPLVLLVPGGGCATTRFGKQDRSTTTAEPLDEASPAVTRPGEAANDEDDSYFTLAAYNGMLQQESEASTVEVDGAVIPMRRCNKGQSKMLP